MTRSVVVKAAHDPEAGVWYVEESDLFGLNAEAETLEGLVEKLPVVISDLLEPGEGEDTEVPVELVCMSARGFCCAPTRRERLRQAAARNPGCKWLRLRATWPRRP